MGFIYCLFDNSSAFPAIGRYSIHVMLQNRVGFNSHKISQLKLEYRQTLSQFILGNAQADLKFCKYSFWQPQKRHVGTVNDHRELFR